MAILSFLSKKTVNEPWDTSYNKTPRQKYASPYVNMSTQQNASVKPKTGVYDQFGNQIGSSPTYQTVTVPTQSIQNPTKLSTPTLTPTSTPTSPANPTAANPNQAYLDKLRGLMGQQQANFGQASNDYLAKLKALNDQQTQGYSDYAKNYAGQLQGLSDRSAQRQQDMIGTLQSGFSRFEDAVRGRVGDEEARTEEARGMVEEQSGAALRQSAQAKREAEAQLGDLFAALGTTDSGRFQDLLTNMTANFTAGQQQIIREKAGQLNELTRGLTEYKRQADTLINQELANLQQNIANINNSIDQNTTQYGLAIQQVYQDAQDKVFGIQQSYLGIENTLAQQAFDLKNQLEQAFMGQEFSIAQQEYERSLGSNQLSEVFLTTGQPQNRTDYEWMMNNPDKYQQLKKMGTDSIASENTSKKMTDQIDWILSRNLGPITGRMQVGGWLNAPAHADTKAAVDNVIATLALAEAGKLKGQGQVSDAERAMLRQAATSLNYNMSEEAFTRELSRIRDMFQSGLPSLQKTTSAISNASLIKQFGG